MEGWESVLIVAVGLVIPALWVWWMLVGKVSIRDTPYMQLLREERKEFKVKTQKERAALLRERQLAEREARERSTRPQ